MSKDDRCFGAIECARERKHDLLKDEDGGRRDRKRDFICAFVRGYLGKHFHLQRLTLSSFLWALFSFTITDCNNEASIHMLTHASGPADKQKWQRCFFLEKLFVIVIFPTLMKFD